MQTNIIIFLLFFLIGLGILLRIYRMLLALNAPLYIYLPATPASPNLPQTPLSRPFHRLPSQISHTRLTINIVITPSDYRQQLG